MITLMCINHNGRKAQILAPGKRPLCWDCLMAQMDEAKKVAEAEAAKSSEAFREKWGDLTSPLTPKYVKDSEAFDPKELTAIEHFEIIRDEHRAGKDIRTLAIRHDLAPFVIHRIIEGLQLETV